MSKTQRLTQLSLLCAMAILLNRFDQLLSLPLGLHVGLANVIAMIVIKQFDGKTMLSINMLRVLIVGLIAGTFMSYPFVMSLTGVLLSSLVLILFNNTDLSLSFVGVIAALAHTAGQLIVISFVIYSKALLGYLPFLIILSVVTGALTGQAATICLRYMKHI